MALFSVLANRCAEVVRGCLTLVSRLPSAEGIEDAIGRETLGLVLDRIGTCHVLYQVLTNNLTTWMIRLVARELWSCS